MTQQEAYEGTPLLASQVSSIPVTRERGQATNAQTTVNMMKTCMGTGILGLPFACSQVGVVFFVVGTLGIGLWNGVTVQRLYICLQYLTGPQDPSTIKRDPPSPPGTSTLGKVAWHCFGATGLQILDVMMAILLFGIITAYLAALVSFLGDTPFSVTPLIDASVAAVLMGICSLVPDLGYLSSASAFGLTVLAGTFVVISGYGVMAGQHGGETLPLWPSTLAGVSRWFGISVFGFGIVPLTYNYYGSMREPDQLVPVAFFSLSATAICYVVVGVGLLYLFPNTNSEILHQIPKTGVLPVFTRLAMAWVVLTTAPLLVVPCGELLEGKWGIGHHRIPVRLGLCLTSALIASLVPSFVQALSLVGCACVGTVSFCLPPAFHLKLARRHSSRRDIMVDSLLLIWGLVATILSTVLTFGK